MLFTCSSTVGPSSYISPLLRHYARVPSPTRRGDQESQADERGDSGFSAYSSFSSRTSTAPLDEFGYTLTLSDFSFGAIHSLMHIVQMEYVGGE